MGGDRRSTEQRRSKSPERGSKEKERGSKERERSSKEKERGSKEKERGSKERERGSKERERSFKEKESGSGVKAKKGSREQKKTRKAGSTAGPARIQASEQLRRVEKGGVDEEKSLENKGYIPSRVMGEGAYSKVRKATKKVDGKSVAIKIIDRSKASSRFLSLFLPREISIAKSVKHKHVVQFIEHFTQGHTTYVVMELAAKGDLEQYISLRGRYKETSHEDNVHVLFRQTFEALSYLHGRKICHRDLKCENLFLGTDGEVKVGDFGFARLMEESDTSSTYCGSKAYAAPELLSQTPYKGAAADIWSVGVIFYIALTARMPFDDRDITAMITKQRAHSIHLDSRYFKKRAKELLLDLIHPEPEKRPSATAALDYAWFKAPSTEATTPS